MTGGVYETRNEVGKVSRYGIEGWQEDLPQLNIGRVRHGCGSYVSGGDRLSWYGALGIWGGYSLLCYQVLLVTGGQDYPDYLDSTELLVPGSGSWRLVTGLLPQPMIDVRVATIDNVVFLLGRYQYIDHEDLS